MRTVDRERWHEIEPLLDEALELTAEQQVTWLMNLRSTSPDLAQELERLLAEDAAANAGGFLSESARVVIPETSLAGLQLGAYTLERPLGEGGMGWVWLARRTDGRFEGVAAVKLLNIGLTTPSGQERFRREASALARLAHPGIARMLDAGVAATGQPYIVLEHVEGQPVDAYVEARDLPVARRIDLVLQVLAAVGHAHTNLIVHRDIKPSNILVTDDGTAKLLDFGIAKLLSNETQSERTALTVAGQRALTPEFAAPEQIDGGDVTTATDLYGAGTLLYVLLAGHRPFDLAGRSLSEARQIICETEAARPSVVVRAAGNAKRARELEGDLDAIVLKAMRKEPVRRYPSAAAFAEDLQRFLDGKPVNARPDSLPYRARKFIRRHRGGVVIAASIPMLLSGAVVRERTLRTRAEHETQKAKAVEEYLVSVFDMADPLAPPNVSGEEVSARALLDRGAARIDSALADQPEVRGELNGVLGRVYTNLALYDKAVPLLRRSLDQQRARFGPRSVKTADAMVRLGVALAEQSQFEEAEPLLREAVAQRRTLLGNTDTLTARALADLATLLQRKEDFVGAEAMFKESLDIMRSRVGSSHPTVSQAMNDLGVFYFIKGQYENALPNYRAALGISIAHRGENHPLTAQILHNLAQTLYIRGELEEAEVMYRRALAAKRVALGNAHPSVTINLNNLGNMLVRIPGRVDEAETLIREALALDRQMFGEQHDFVAASLNNLGHVLRAKGQFDEARATYQKSLEINLAVFGPDHSRVALAYSGLGSVAYLSGRLDESISLLRHAHALYRKSVGEKHINYHMQSYNLGRALRDAGRYSEAEILLRDILSRIDTTTKSKRVHMVVTQSALGTLLTVTGRAAEALPMLQNALTKAEAELGDQDSRTAEVRWALGNTYAALRDRGRAVPLLQSAYSTLRQDPAQTMHAMRARNALRALGVTTD